MERAIAIIERGTVEDMHQLTRDIAKKDELRVQLAAESSVWRALAAKIESIGLENASIDTSNSTLVTTAVLQLANNMSASIVSGKMALQSNFISDIVGLELPTSQHRLICQIMANLSVGFNRELHTEVELLFNQGLELSDIDYFDVSDDISIAFPILIMHVNIARSLRSWSPESTYKLLVIWGSILQNVSKWFSNPEKHKILIQQTMELAVVSFANGIYGELAKKYSSSPLLSYPLYKVFGSLVESAAADEKQREELASSENIKGSIATTIDLLKCELSEFTEAMLKNRYMEHMLSGLKVIELLRIYTSLAKVIPEMIVPQYRNVLLKPLIHGLRATKNLPAKSKLKVNEESELLPRDFPYLKCLLISALTDLVVGNRDAQNAMREEGGLLAVLECCVIDGNNPFMKEHAILCLRFLLESNPENQAFVEKMEAKQLADPEVLAQAGYETEIVNGRITIRKSA